MIIHGRPHASANKSPPITDTEIVMRRLSDYRGKKLSVYYFLYHFTISGVSAMRNFCVIVLLFFNFFITASGDGPATLSVESYLVAGPVAVSSPVLNVGDRNVVALGDLLTYDYIPVTDLVPSMDGEFEWHHDNQLRWRETHAADHKLRFTAPDNNTNMYYAAIYLRTDRWMKVDLNVESCHLFEAYINGEKFMTKTGSEKPDNEPGVCSPGSATHTLTLKKGKHALLIKSLNDPENSADWYISTSITIALPFAREDLVLTFSPERYINIKNVLDDPRVGSVYITGNGEFGAVQISTPVGSAPHRETWIKIFNLRNGALVRTFRGDMAIENFAWAPDSKRFSYVQRKAGKATLWIVNLDNGDKQALLQDVENFGSYEWSPIGNFIVFSISQKDEEDTSSMKRITKPVERWPWWATRSYLHIVHVPSGSRQRLTAGALTTNLNSISPDGRKIILSRTTHEFTEWPYSFTELYTLDPATMSLDTIAAGPWSANAQWSPDGTKILITAGPSFFGDKGVNVPDGMFPNEYDTQAYIYDIATGAVEAISREFHPSISSAHWSKAERAIYFTTTDKSYNNVFRYDLTSGLYEKIELGIDIVREIDFAHTGPVAVYTGESVNQPPRFYSIDLSRKRITMLYDPNEESYRHIRTGDVGEWTFTNERGVEIDGMIYYPPDFDANKKYPLIVYYYGGVTPVTRDFEGRYPKNKWAAHGYIVYVLQPSGAIGYGQEFSAYHVNDWGKIVSQEIIDGTEKFIEAHDFVDRDRIAGIGASYGGFMTLLLLTQTDLFTTAVAHAGISSISSYWGEGYWGYSYNAVAAAHSFPWNRRDIFIDQSPLFYADKINTPLLLLTGDSDTNVPPGESTQLFVALTMLGKEVEYIQVEGQDHHILDYDKRIKWGDTIIAWFDKYLKNQPEWWNELYTKEK
jgi:dipeptidyl aminopeptidase/acylaminoacyl peptidase